MKILAVSHPCVTDVNQQFYAELETLGHEVQLVVPSNFQHEYSEGPVSVARWSTLKGHIEQRKVGMSSSIPLHYYKTCLRSFIKSYAPDILYVEEEPYSISAWQAFQASKGLPMKRVFYSAQNIVKRYPVPFSLMERYVISRADGAAVVSSEVHSALIDKGYHGKVMDFPLGVDTNQFQPRELQRQEIRYRLRIGDSFVVGYIGRFVEEKGILNILESIPYFNQENVIFLFLGNGPLLPEVMKAQTRHPECVIVANSVSHREVQDWINAMDVLLLPSLTLPNWKEQFGRVIIEALACQVPVIGSDSGEIPVLLRKTGGGWIFPEGNVAKLVELIYYVRNNERIRSLFADRGYQEVVNRYSKRALAASFAERVRAL